MQKPPTASTRIFDRSPRAMAAFARASATFSALLCVGWPLNRSSSSQTFQRPSSLRTTYSWTDMAALPTASGFSSAKAGPHRFLCRSRHRQASMKRPISPLVNSPRGNEGGQTGAERSARGESRLSASTASGNRRCSWSPPLQLPRFGGIFSWHNDAMLLLGFYCRSVARHAVAGDASAPPTFESRSVREANFTFPRIGPGPIILLTVAFRFFDACGRP
jgi:hypothetical protein